MSAASQAGIIRGMRLRIGIAAATALALIAAYVLCLVHLMGNTGISADGPLSPTSPALTAPVPGGLSLEKAAERCDPYQITHPDPYVTLKLVGGEIDGRWYYACYEIGQYDSEPFLGHVIEAASGVTVDDDSVLRRSGAWKILNSQGFEAQGIEHEAQVTPFGMLAISAGFIGFGLLWTRWRPAVPALPARSSRRPTLAPTPRQALRRAFDWVHTRRGAATILGCVLALTGLRIIVDYGTGYGPVLTWANLLSSHSSRLLYGMALASYPNELLVLALIGLSAAWLHGAAAAAFLSRPRRAKPAVRGPIAAEISAAIESVRADLAPRWDGQVVAAASAICDELSSLLVRVDELSPTSPDLFILRRIPTSYLPDTLDPYFKLPRDYATNHQMDDGTTPRERVLAQLNLLRGRLDQVRDAMASQDLQALVVNGRFLETRFASAPLAVPGDPHGRRSSGRRQGRRSD